MCIPVSAIIGRTAELRAIEEFLCRASHDPAVHVLTGDAGIGKTILLNAGVEQARTQGFQVMSCNPAASEMQLSFAGLSDLLADADSSIVDRLPLPQRLALNAALLHGPVQTSPVDPRAVAAGFLSYLNTLVQQRPVLIAIDDIQWLDQPTRDVVEFAVRRCHGPVGVLIAWRTGEDAVAAMPVIDARSGTATVIHLPPLRAGDLHQIVRASAGAQLVRSVVDRIVETSGGNPFFARELARTAVLNGYDPNALPDSLQSIVRHRIGQVEPIALELLQMTALLAAPCLQQLADQLDEAEVAAVLGTVEDLGVVHLAPDGAVRFTHPLLAAGVMAEMTPKPRRELHQRLSDTVHEPEERARHLALATLGPDPAVVQALDLAATHARRRGAPGTAAELLELAAARGSNDALRACLAAQDHFNAGNPARARHLLQDAIEALSHGVARARAMALLGIILFETEGRGDSIDLLQQAIDEADNDAGERCSIRVDLAFVLFVTGRIADARQCIAAAVEESSKVDDAGLVAEILASSVIIGFLSGDGIDEDLLNRSLDLEDPLRRTPVRRWPSTVAAQVYRWTHQLDRALDAFAALRKRCLDNGFESDLWFLSLGAIPAAYWAGDLNTACLLTSDAIERAQIIESDQALAMARLFETQVLAWTGNVQEARVSAAEATRLFASGDVTTIRFELPAALGMAELSLGNYAVAASHLAPAALAAIEMRFAEPASAQFLPDAVEALVGAGRIDEAEPIARMLETHAEREEALWGKAVALRCRGLLLANGGRSQDAEHFYARALDAHDRIPHLYYDRGRTLLVQSAVLRRHNKRGAARAALLQAADLFERVGASAWARQATTAVSRLGLQPGAGAQLTPAEEQVARLAASGLTSREVAAALSIRPKTVEAHLTHIYRKLDIRSRAELGWHMARRSAGS